MALGKCPGRAEVFFSLDDAAAEELSPVAVDGNAGGEGIGRISQPLSYADAIWWCAFGERMEGGGDGGLDLFAFVEKAAAHVDVGGPVFVAIELGKDGDSGWFNSVRAVFARRRFHCAAWSVRGRRRESSRRVFWLRQGCAGRGLCRSG